MKHVPLRRLGAIAALAGLSLLLTGCLLSPGKFTSTLDVRKNRRFAFAYTGEIHMLPDLTDPFEGEPAPNINIAVDRY